MHWMIIESPKVILESVAQAKDFPTVGSSQTDLYSMCSGIVVHLHILTEDNLNTSTSNSWAGPTGLPTPLGASFLALCRIIFSAVERL